MAHKAEKPYINAELQKKLLDEFCILYNSDNNIPVTLYIAGGSALQLKSQLCMKITSRREKDNSDVVALARKLKSVGCSYEVVESRLNELYCGRVEINNASLKRVRSILKRR